MIFAHGYSMVMKYNTDPLGVLYGTIAAIWSIVLLYGAWYLILNRRQPCVRLRNIPLSLSAVGMLHVYWALCFLAYVLQGHFPCGVEFWIMSVYLPLGIALFHAANTQLLQVAMTQKQYLGDYTPVPAKSDNESKSLRWHKYASIFTSNDKVKRTIGYISCFMVLQLMCTLFIFTISRKFHPAFGLVGSSFESQLNNEQCIQETAICEAANRLACRRGWEWIPSILWQLFWTWIYVPYLIYSLRGIKDVHGWRTQTIVCCLAGLLASPMWLAGLYVPQMSLVSRYFIPPMWFTPSIFLIEALTVFVPVHNVLSNKRLERHTEQIIKEWQNKRQGNTTSSGDGSTLVEAGSSHQGSTISSAGIYKGQMYTMEALEMTLRQNPQPLLRFASLRDFSGENISFLVAVMNWKIDWLPPSPIKPGFFRRSRLSMRGMKGDSFRRHQFEQALNIYMSFVSLKYSNYSINLSSPQYKQLEDIFEDAATITNGPSYSHTDTVTPFNNVWTAPVPDDNPLTIHSRIEKVPSKDQMSTVSTITRHESNVSTDSLVGHSSHHNNYSIRNTDQKLPDHVQVPSTFNSQIFDTAEESIKYMVLTNTWSKFVKSSESNANKQGFLERVRAVCV